MKAEIRFIVGGSRSGKSSRAEAIARSLAGEVVYVATCRTSGLDDEMTGRIRRHQEQRPPDWRTVEDRFDLEELAEECAGRILLLDYFTLWLAHWLESESVDAMLRRLQSSLAALRNHAVQAIVVSNEVGCGIVPLGAETRAYRDLVGWANRMAAREADVVEWLVAGIPVKIKGRATRLRATSSKSLAASQFAALTLAAMFSIHSVSSSQGRPWAKARSWRIRCSRNSSSRRSSCARKPSGPEKCSP